MLNFSSDEETDRLLSAKAASSVPLPPEIALTDPKGADDLFRRRAYYGMMGVADHPLVKFLEGFEIDRNMASEVSRARYLDRLSHYSAWLGRADPVQTIAVDGKTERVLGGAVSPPSPSSAQPHPIPHGRRQAASNTGRAGVRTHVHARRPSFRGGASGDAAASPDDEKGVSETSSEDP